MAHLDNLKQLFQLDHELPIGLAQVLLKIRLGGVNALPADATDELVLLVKVPPKQLLIAANRNNLGRTGEKDGEGRWVRRRKRRHSCQTGKRSREEILRRENRKQKTCREPVGGEVKEEERAKEQTGMKRVQKQGRSKRAIKKNRKGIVSGHPASLQHDTHLDANVLACFSNLHILVVKLQGLHHANVKHALGRGGLPTLQRVIRARSIQKQASDRTRDQCGRHEARRPNERKGRKT